LVEGAWDRVRRSNGLVPFIRWGDGPDKGFLEQSQGKTLEKRYTV
jgi:hypothetical protein